MKIVSRNKRIIEPYGGMIEHASFSKLLSHLTNPDAFSQQENDQVEEERATVANDMFDEHDTVVTLEENFPIPAYTAPILMSDDELTFMIRYLNCQQYELFHIDQSWAKQYVKTKSLSNQFVLEPLKIFLTRDAGCGKSFLMKFVYTALTKTLSYQIASIEKPKMLLMTPTAVAVISIKGTTMHSALNIPIGCFRKSLMPLADKMKSSFRNDCQI